MAAKTWWLTNDSVSVGSDLSDTDPGADAYRSPTTGWVVGTGSTNHSPYANDVEQASSTFVDTNPPDGSLDTTNGDFFTSPTALTGDFAAGTWTVRIGVRAQTNGGAQDGRFRVRIFKGANQDGTSATEVTSAQQSSDIATDISTSTTNVLTASFDPGAFSVSNQYIFFQIGWERTGAGGMSTSDVNLRIGNDLSSIITSNFTASGGGSVQPPRSMHQFRLRHNREGI